MSINEKAFTEELLVGLTNNTNDDLKLSDFLYNQLCLYDLILLKSNTEFDLQFFSALAMAKIIRLVEKGRGDRSEFVANTLSQMVQDNSPPQESFDLLRTKTNVMYILLHCDRMTHSSSSTSQSSGSSSSLRDTPSSLRHVSVKVCDEVVVTLDLIVAHTQKLRAAEASLLSTEEVFLIRGSAAAAGGGEEKENKTKKSSTTQNRKRSTTTKSILTTSSNNSSGSGVTPRDASFHSPLSSTVNLLHGKNNNNTLPELDCLPSQSASDVPFLSPSQSALFAEWAEEEEEEEGTLNSQSQWAVQEEEEKETNDEEEECDIFDDEFTLFCADNNNSDNNSRLLPTTDPRNHHQQAQLWRNHSLIGGGLHSTCVSRSASLTSNYLSNNNNNNNNNNSGYSFKRTLSTVSTDTVNTIHENENEVEKEEVEGGAQNDNHAKSGVVSDDSQASDVDNNNCSSSGGGVVNRLL
eukprot:gene23598-29834_t